MKVLSSLKSAKARHRDCKVVRRRGKIFVICKSNPRFKARQRQASQPSGCGWPYAGPTRCKKPPSGGFLFYAAFSCRFCCNRRS